MRDNKNEHHDLLGHFSNTMNMKKRPTKRRFLHVQSKREVGRGQPHCHNGGRRYCRVRRLRRRRVNVRRARIDSHFPRRRRP
jgi:hypothetical protein